MYIIYIFRTIVLIFVAILIATFRPLYVSAFFRWLECRTWPFISLTGVDCSSFTSHMAQWIEALVTSSGIPKKSVSSIPGEGSGKLSEGKITGEK